MEQTLTLKVCTSNKLTVEANVTRFLLIVSFLQTSLKSLDVKTSLKPLDFKIQLHMYIFRLIADRYLHYQNLSNDHKRQVGKFIFRQLFRHIR